VDARLPVDDLNDLLGTDFEDDDYETLGGMVYGTLEHIPRAGESVELGGWRFSVEKVRAQRILLLKVTPLSRSPEERDT
jgi:magnesium and cobalt transporter